MSSSRVNQRTDSTVRADIPLLLWLVVVWGALWGDWGLGNLAFGLILALVVTRALALPSIQLSGRFNLFHFLVFVVSFVWQVVLASFHVFWLALTKGPAVHNAVVGVQLRQNNDLMMTLVGHTMALIPGSLVVEVDRGSGILYLHVLDVDSEDEARQFRESALEVEAAWIRIMGSRQDLQALQRESDTARGVRARMVHSPATQMHRAAKAAKRGRE